MKRATHAAKKKLEKEKVLMELDCEFNLLHCVINMRKIVKTRGNLNAIKIQQIEIISCCNWKRY